MQFFSKIATGTHFLLSGHKLLSWTGISGNLSASAVGSSRQQFFFLAVLFLAVSVSFVMFVSTLSTD